MVIKANLLYIFMLFLFSCSKGPVSKGAFKLVINRQSLSTDVGTNGGAFVKTVDLVTNAQTLYPLDATQTATITSGKYDLLFVSFAGPEQNSGEMLCGSMSTVDLSVAEITLTINMSLKECETPKFSQTILELKKSGNTQYDVDRWDLSYWK